MILLTLSNLYKQKKKSGQGKRARGIGEKFNRYKVTVIKMNKI